MRTDTWFCPRFSGPFIAFIHSITQLSERVGEPPSAKSSPPATLIGRKLLKIRCKISAGGCREFFPFGAQ
jgi:hypothetical protein